MKYTITTDYFTEEYMKQYELLPKPIQKKLDLLSKKMNLINKELFFEEYNGEIKVGDIFTIQVQKDCYIYGKVLCDQVSIRDLEYKLNAEFVVTIYTYTSHTIELPKEPLTLDQLLIRPHLTISYLFTSGLAKIIGNIPLTSEEINIDLGFLHGTNETTVELDSNDREPIYIEKEVRNYYNVKGEIISNIPKYLGSTRIEGLGILNDIVRELIINPEIMDVEYIIEKPKKLKKKTTKHYDFELPIVDQITNQMISYNKSIHNLDKNMKQIISYFKELSYEFHLKSITCESIEDFQILIKEYVLELNKLNEASYNSLIETDEREAIYEYIIQTAISLEYHFDYDPTEQYREW